MSGIESESRVERLRRGNDFEEKVRCDWLQTAGGKLQPHQYCKKPRGRRGFMDIYVEPDKESTDPLLTAIIEIKCSDWDAMTDKAVKRNLARQINQIWDYVDSETIKEIGGKEPTQPCMGVIFPSAPKQPGRRAFIENAFNEQGIQVVWYDEK